MPELNFAATPRVMQTSQDPPSGSAAPSGPVIGYDSDQPSTQGAIDKQQVLRMVPNTVTRDQRRAAIIMASVKAAPTSAKLTGGAAAQLNTNFGGVSKLKSSGGTKRGNAVSDTAAGHRTTSAGHSTTSAAPCNDYPSNTNCHCISNSHHTNNNHCSSSISCHHPYTNHRHSDHNHKHSKN